MLYTCDACGKRRADQTIDAERNLAICPECGHARPFARMPLFAVGGASCTGKTAVCKALVGKVPGVVALDGDVLWDGKSYSPQDTKPFYEDALRIAMNIAQSGLCVALFHAGFGVPPNLENCVARRYFSAIHYLDLYCSEEEQEKRLLRRPAAQGPGGAGFVKGMLGFNQFLRFHDFAAEGFPAPEKLDTTGRPLEETAAQVIAWIDARR